MSATLTSLKLSLNGEIRRLSVNTEGLTYQALVEKTLSLFPHLGLIQFSWVDDENDKVVISSNEELSEALRVMASTSKGYLRFDILPAEPEPSSQLNQNSSSEKSSAGCSATTSSSFGIITHAGVGCDQCGVYPLVGSRFKCSVRDSYDMCEACEAKPQPYPTIKIYRPDQVPVGVMVLVEEGLDSRQGGLFGGGGPGGKAYHRGVECDVCNIRNFHGPRFKCTTRRDYDLCEACEAQDSHDHVMVKIQPQHAHMNVQVIPDDPKLKDFNSIPYFKQFFWNSFGGPGRRCGVHNGLGRHGRPHHGPHRHGPPHPPRGPGEHGPPPPPPHGLGHSGSPFPQGMDHGPHHVRAQPHRACHENQEPNHHKRGCGRWRSQGRHCWDRTSIAEAAAARARMHASSKEEQERAHKEKEASALEDEMLEMCIRQSLDEKERMERERSESVPTTASVTKSTSALSNNMSRNDGQAEEKGDDEPASKPVPKKLTARFVKDVTMPDGSEIAPCSTFFKTWRVRNDGDVDWPEGCVLVSAGGDSMFDPKLGDGHEIRQDVPMTPVGSEVDLKVELYAPNVTGRHVSYFRLQNPEGENFGQRLWADIRVNEADMSLSMTLSPWEVIDENEEVEEACLPSETKVVEVDKVDDDRVPTSEEREQILEDTPVTEVNATESACQEVSESQQLEAQFDADIQRWARELQVLAAMGFNDFDYILPVLKEHIDVPSSEMDGESPEGLQAVVMALLSRDE